MLHIVVQRTLDEGHGAQHPRHQTDPVIVEVGELARREGQRVGQQVAPEQRRRAGHRIGHQQRQEVLVVGAADAPVGVRDQLALAVDDARVAVDELRAADLGQQRLELVRVPGVVLVGHGHEVRAGGRQAERALEVPVEVQPLGRARDDEARIVRHRLLEGGKALGTRAVVGDHAHPVAMGLGADRVQLAPQQLGRRVEGGHAHGHERACCGLRGVDLDRAGGALVDDDAGDGGFRLASAVEHGAQAQVELGSGRPGRHPHEPPEAAAEAAQLGVLLRVRVGAQAVGAIGVHGRVEGPEDVSSRHQLRHHRLGLTVEDERERADPVVGREAPAADEQRRARPHRQPLGQRVIELHVQLGPGSVRGADGLPRRGGAGGGRHQDEAWGSSRWSVRARRGSSSRTLARARSAR